MNVRELKEFLEFCDDEAQVIFVSQPNWPFEYSIRDAFIRSDLEDEYEEGEDPGNMDEDEREAYEEWLKEQEAKKQEFADHLWKDRFGYSNSALPQNEVLLIEGSQLCYASKKWFDR